MVLIGQEGSEIEKIHIKMILAGLSALLITESLEAGGAAWQVYRTAEAGQFINGRLEIGSLDFFSIGVGRIETVRYDKAGTGIASGGQINVSYQFDDLLGGRFILIAEKSASKSGFEAGDRGKTAAGV